MFAIVHVREAPKHSSLTVTDCYFNSGNSSTKREEHLVIFLLRDTLSLDFLIGNCLFEENEISLIEGTGNVVIVDSVIRNNHEALFNMVSAQVLIANSTLSGNIEDSALITFDGFSSLKISHSVVQGSRTQSIIYMGLVPNENVRSSFFFDSVVFNDNFGFYILNANGVNGLISNCTFENNTLSSLYLINSNTGIANTSFLNNSGPYSQIVNYADNDGVSLGQVYRLEISNSTFQSYGILPFVNANVHSP